MDYPSTPPRSSLRSTASPSPSAFLSRANKTNGEDSCPRAFVPYSPASAASSRAQNAQPSTPPLSPPAQPASPEPFVPSAEDLQIDAETEARIKHSDYVYEMVLKHMDWDGRRGPRLRTPFSPFYFLQPASAPQYQASGLPASVPVQTWADDGSLEWGTAVWISSEEEMKELQAWAKKQGEGPLGGRLLGQECFMNGEKGSGKLLVGI